MLPNLEHTNSCISAPCHIRPTGLQKERGEGEGGGLVIKECQLFRITY
jgi:hypothetical protein